MKILPTYLLPQWLQDLAKEDDLTAQCIQDGQLAGASQLHMYEGLIRMDSERTRFLLQELERYREIFGPIPEVPANLEDN
jgi:hypothetical protein